MEWDVLKSDAIIKGSSIKEIGKSITLKTRVKS